MLGFRSITHLDCNWQYTAGDRSHGDKERYTIWGEIIYTAFSFPNNVFFLLVKIMAVLLLIKVFAEGFLSVLWGSFPIKEIFCEPSDWRMNPERTPCM